LSRKFAPGGRVGVGGAKLLAVSDEVGGGERATGYGGHGVDLIEQRTRLGSRTRVDARTARPHLAQDRGGEVSCATAPARGRKPNNRGARLEPHERLGIVEVNAALNTLPDRLVTRHKVQPTHAQHRDGGDANHG